MMRSRQLLALGVLTACGFVFGYTTSRANPVQRFSPRDLPSGIEEELDAIEAKWRRHEIEKTVLLDCLGQSLRVEIVDDGREASYGFADNPWSVDDLYACSPSEFEVYKERGRASALFVIIQKPYLFGLKSAPEAPDGKPAVEQDER